mmetsp:Transcript_102356/g.330102  ORF Transcript_102356/g.330102 Transcript_102356/m.330102 type:complete len:369 (-) Transcript_102356:16-1122(-)
MPSRSPPRPAPCIRPGPPWRSSRPCTGARARSPRGRRPGKPLRTSSLHSRRSNAAGCGGRRRCPQLGRQRLVPRSRPRVPPLVCRRRRARPQHRPAASFLQHRRPCRRCLQCLWRSGRVARRVPSARLRPLQRLPTQRPCLRHPYRRHPRRPRRPCPQWPRLGSRTARRWPTRWPLGQQTRAVPPLLWRAQLLPRRRCARGAPALRRCRRRLLLHRRPQGCRRPRLCRRPQRCQSPQHCRRPRHCQRRRRCLRPLGPCRQSGLPQQVRRQPLLVLQWLRSPLQWRPQRPPRRTGPSCSHSPRACRPCPQTESLRRPKRCWRRWRPSLPPWRTCGRPGWACSHSPSRTALTSRSARSCGACGAPGRTCW